MKGFLEWYHSSGFFTKLAVGAFGLYGGYKLTMIIFGGFLEFLQMAALVAAPLLLGLVGLLPFASVREKAGKGVTWLVNLAPELMDEIYEDWKTKNKEAKEKAEIEKKKLETEGRVA